MKKNILDTGNQIVTSRLYENDIIQEAYRQQQLRDSQFNVLHKKAENSFLKQKRP